MEGPYEIGQWRVGQRGHKVDLGQYMHIGRLDLKELW